MNMDDRIKTDAQLSEIIAEVGARYGFSDAKAEFSAFKDFKLNWTRSRQWISLNVSDYLKDAPRGAIEDLFGHVFERIQGNTPEYGTALRDYLVSAEFLEHNRDRYIRRHRDLRQDGGWMSESIARLKAKGLDVPEDLVCMEYSEQSNKKSGASKLMKVISLNVRYADLPEDVRDYALWTQIAHVCGEFAMNDCKGAPYVRRLDMYPGRSDAERYLHATGMDLD